MVVPISVTINARGALKKIGKVNKFIRIDIPRLTFQQADKGAEYAARIAPVNTGALMQAIKVQQTEKGQGVAGWAVVSKTPPNIRNNNPKRKPYHAYLEYGKQVGIRKGKTQRYMQATAAWLTKEYPELIKKSLFKNIKR